MKYNQDESKKQQNNDVFAIFKSYKKTSESSSVNTDINHKSDIQNIKRLVDDKNDSPIVQTYKEKRAVTQGSKSKLTPSRANRFTYKGKFDSNSFFKTSNNKVKIDFASFKKMTSK